METYTYDINGALLSASNPDHKVSWQRDILGRTEGEWQDEIGCSKVLDQSGQLIKRTSGFFGNGIDFDYDPGGYLKEVRSNGDRIARFQHSPRGELTETSFSSGMKHIRKYLPTGELEESVTMRPRREDHRTCYAWDKSGLLTSVDDNFSGVSKLSYSPNKDLTSMIYPEGDTQWFHLQSDGRDVIGAPTDPQERITHVGNYRYTWSANGELLEKRSREQVVVFSYDVTGRLSSSGCVRKQGDWQELPLDLDVTTLASKAILDPSETVSTYRYDALGRRTEKVTRSASGEEQTVSFFWDSDQLLGEAVKGTRGVTHRIEHVFHPGSFTPIAQLDSIKERSCYFVLDVRGAPRAAYNSEGKVIWEAHLSAFGKVRWQEGNPELVKHHLLGQYSDEETGLFYNRFRYFDPDLCGYISPDPIGLAGGLEPWNYPTDPFTWADPLGLVKEGCGGSGGAGSDHKYHPAPKQIDAFPDLQKAKAKTPVQGGGGFRKRWIDNKRNIYEWDSQHGALEKYTKKGKHLGEFDPKTGSQTKPADPSRDIKKYL